MISNCWGGFGYVLSEVREMENVMLEEWSRWVCVGVVQLSWIGLLLIFCTC